MTPMQRHLYPDDWEQISRDVRARADNRCEFCGAVNGQPHPVTGSKVVLTVAHLDNDPRSRDPDRLRSLCQRCHLTYDAQLHAKHARQTRRRKQIEAGQQEMGI